MCFMVYIAHLNNSTYKTQKSQTWKKWAHIRLIKCQEITVTVQVLGNSNGFGYGFCFTRIFKLLLRKRTLFCCYQPLWFIAPVMLHTCNLSFYSIFLASNLGDNYLTLKPREVLIFIVYVLINNTAFRMGQLSGNSFWL